MQLFTSNRISGLSLVVIAAAVWLYAGTFPVLDENHPGPSLFPRMIALSIAIAGVALVFTRSTPKEAEATVYEFSGDHFRLMGLLAGTALIPLLYEFAGLMPCIAGIVLLAGFLFKANWRAAILTAAGTTLAIYWIFGLLLGVPI
ncbi:MAG: tripartite tricarboxylate transporter TctB family protein [Bacteroidia bacterium]